MNNIDTGDLVYHHPSGEMWLVAHVQGDRLAWCGWPAGLAELKDCELTKKATAYERDKLLHRLAEITEDFRGSYARETLRKEAIKVKDFESVKNAKKAAIAGLSFYNEMMERKNENN